MAVARKRLPLAHEGFHLSEHFFQSLGVGNNYWTATVSNGAVASTSSAQGNINGVSLLSANTGNAANRATLAMNLLGLLAVGGPMSCRAYVMIPSVSTATNRFTVRVGIGDAVNGDTVDGIYFEANNYASEFWNICTASSSTRTKNATSVSIVAGTWYKLEWFLNENGTLVTFKINDVVVGTISTNIPSGTGQQCSPWIQIQRTGVNGTAKVYVNVDFFEITKWYNTKL